MSMPKQIMRSCLILLNIQLRMKLAVSSAPQPPLIRIILAIFIALKQMMMMPMMRVMTVMTRTEARPPSGLASGKQKGGEREEQDNVARDDDAPQELSLVILSYQSRQRCCRSMWLMITLDGRASSSSALDDDPAARKQ